VPYFSLESCCNLFTVDLTYQVSDVEYSVK
jgi:hypothetical protein